MRNIIPLELLYHGYSYVRMYLPLILSEQSQQRIPYSVFVVLFSNLTRGRDRQPTAPSQTEEKCLLT
jgi:hypothetical protein